MARAAKLGLDYFPIDTDMDQDDKICIIEAKHRDGFKIILKLLMAIYREGYYKPWSEEALLVFSARKGLPAEDVRAVVQTATEKGFFSPEMYHIHGILTSSGIQRRYVGGAQKRDRISIHTRYALVSPDDFPERIRSKLVFSPEIGISSPETLYKVTASTHREGGSIGREDREGMGGKGTDAPSPPPAASAVSGPAGRPDDARDDEQPRQPLAPSVIPMAGMPDKLRAATERARLKLEADARRKAEHHAQKTSDYHAVKPANGTPYAARGAPPEPDEFPELEQDSINEREEAPRG